jgi:hypothetical protein
MARPAVNHLLLEILQPNLLRPKLLVIVGAFTCQQAAVACTKRVL